MGENVLIEKHGKAYNKVRPHNALIYKPPAPEAIKQPLNGLKWQKIPSQEAPQQEGAGQRYTSPVFFIWQINKYFRQ